MKCPPPSRNRKYGFDLFTEMSQSQNKAYFVALNSHSWMDFNICLTETVKQELQPQTCWNSSVVPREVLTDEKGEEGEQPGKSWDDSVSFLQGTVCHRLQSDVRHLTHAYPQNLCSANVNQMWGAVGPPTLTWQGQVSAWLIWVWSAVQRGQLSWSHITFERVFREERMLPQ